MDTTTANIEKDDLIGQPLFGSYVITRQIGKGGMGAVYAVESEELGKTLAMKVLLGDAARLSSTISGRFVAEARAASAINHRNIITMIDSAQLPDGRHYILMEYLDGPTLKQFSKEMGRLQTDVALAVLGQVCSGLQAAHDRGIVHRDLKPSNILINPQPDNPYFAKILDFGIAKLSDPALGSVETQTSALAGTPSYMAPEQARALKDVDHRTDIYAVGVLAYRLLSGQLPYRAHSIGELVHQQATVHPISLAVQRPDLPPAWVNLVHSAMAMNPADRPQSAHELAERMIAATPNGEAIARSSASLLFATQNSSFSTTGASASWSEVSMPDGTQSPPTVAPPTVAQPSVAPPTMPLRSVTHATPIQSVPHGTPIQSVSHGTPIQSVPHGAPIQSVSHGTPIQSVPHGAPIQSVPHGTPMGWPGQSQAVANQGSEDGTDSRMLVLILCLSALVVVSIVVTWSVLHDNSTEGVEQPVKNTVEHGIDPAVENPAVVDPAVDDPAVDDPAVVDPAVVDPGDEGSDPASGTETTEPEIAPGTPADEADSETNKPALKSKKGDDPRRKRGSAADRKSRKTQDKEATTPEKSDKTPKIDDEALFNLRK